MVSFLKQCAGSLKTTAGIVRANPSIAWICSVVFTVLTAVGIYAVYAANSLEVEKAKDHAQSVADEVAANIRLKLGAMMQPAAALGIHISEYPSWPVVASRFGALSEKLLAQVEPAGAISVLQLAPFANISAVFPVNNDTITGIGFSLLDIDARTQNTIENARAKRLSLIGPLLLLEGYLAMWATFPVFVTQVSSDETFGIPFPLSPKCPPELAYNTTTGERFWGMVFALIYLDSLLGNDTAELVRLRSNGYNYLVVQPATDLAATEGFSGRTVLARSSDLPHDPVSRVIDLDTALVSRFVPWTLYVAPKDGWGTNWEAPLYAAVVIISFLVTLLLFLLLVSIRQHQMLIYSLLPRNVVSYLFSGDSFLRAGAQDEGGLMGSGTPAELLLDMLTGFITGTSPSVRDVVLVRTAILQARNIYQPLELGRMFKEAHLEDDEAMNLMRELGADLGVMSQEPRQNNATDKWMEMHNADDAQGPASLMSQDSADLQFSTLEGGLMGICNPTFGVTPHNLHHSSSNMDTAGCKDSRKNSYTATATRGPSVNAALHAAPEAAESLMSRLLSVRVDRTLISQASGSQLASAIGPGSGPTAPLLHTASGTVTHTAPAAAVNTNGSGLQDHGTSANGRGNPVLAGGVGSRLHAALLASSATPGTASGVKEGSGSGTAVQHPAPAIELPVYEELNSLLAEAEASWTFDSFRLMEVSQGHGLSTLGFFLMSRTGIMEAFSIRPAKMARLLRALEAHYQNNPYHNATHATDVLQTMSVVLTRGGLVPHYADKLTHFAALLAAAAHDLDHRGLTNDFLISTDDELAIRYNDRSPMENHHLATLFSLMHRPGLDVMSHMARTDRDKLRKLCIELVLATDMKHHFSTVSQFCAFHRLNPKAAAGDVKRPRRDSLGAVPRSPAASNPTSAADAAHQADPATPSAAGARAPESGAHRDKDGTPKETRVTSLRRGGVPLSSDSNKGGTKPLSLTATPSQQSIVGELGVWEGHHGEATTHRHPKPVDEAERLLALQVALKCSDIGSLCETLPVYKRWTASLEEEFFAQGDREKAAGLPVSPLFDRDKPGVSKSQIGFFDFVAIPLFNNFTRVFPGAWPLMEQLMSNYMHHKERQSSVPGAATRGAHTSSLSSQGTSHHQLKEAQPRPESGGAGSPGADGKARKALEGVGSHSGRFIKMAMAVSKSARHSNEHAAGSASMRLSHVPAQQERSFTTGISGTRTVMSASLARLKVAMGGASGAGTSGAHVLKTGQEEDHAHGHSSSRLAIRSSLLNGEAAPGPHEEPRLSTKLITMLPASLIDTVEDSKV